MLKKHLPIEIVYMIVTNTNTAFFIIFFVAKNFRCIKFDVSTTRDTIPTNTY